MAISDDLIYEVNDKGQRVVVKSMESTQHAYLRFSNKTKRPVDIWWRNFQGIRRHYVRLPAGSYYDINTFLTHPWEFTDASTKENYRINNKIIFRAPNNVGGMLYRTNWNISIGMRSLRSTAMLAIASLMVDSRSVEHLELPRPLEREVKELVDSLSRMLPLPGE